MQKIALFVLFAVLPAWAIVDIAPVEIGEKAGVSGNVAASYASKSGNTEKEEYDFSGKIQYDSNESYLFFVQASYERAESFDVKTEDQLYSHARYLHKLGRDDLYGELFFQYRENVFKGIDTRYLLGANVRWRVVNKADFGKLYIGLGAFHEEMDYTDAVPDQDESTVRMNSYLAYTNQISDNAKLNMNAYYQPSLEQSSDEYLSFLAELELHVVKQLYLSFVYELDYDSMPPLGVEKQYRMVKTSLSWKF